MTWTDEDEAVLVALQQRKRLHDACVLLNETRNYSDHKSTCSIYEPGTSVEQWLTMDSVCDCGFDALCARIYGLTKDCGHADATRLE